jgi:ADP-ribosylglycohydrolase
VPAAIYCFLRTPHDPVEVILTAANGSYDDTLASTAGNIAGACHGADRLRREAPRGAGVVERSGVP